MPVSKSQTDRRGVAAEGTRSSQVAVGARTRDAHPAERRGLLDVVAAWVRQWFVERRLRARDGSFRTTDQRTVAQTYGAMSDEEFERVNGPQEWLNEHVIPRALRARAADRPWRIVDLGCGNGGSSCLLARNAPPGSELIGYDLCANLLARARERDYCDAAGGVLAVTFVRQSILEPLRDAHGRHLATGSVDIAHAAGVVGHHLAVEDVDALAAELRRVLAPDGLAILDAGPRVTPRQLQRELGRHGFELVARHRVVPVGVRVPMSFRIAAGQSVCR